MERENIGAYLKRIIRQSGMIGKLIAINTAMFILFALIEFIGNNIHQPVIDSNGVFILGFGTEIKGYFIAPGNISELIYKPWSIFTHMFMHGGFTHYFFNMVMLYFSGRIFIIFFGERRLLSTYLIGGIFAYFIHISLYALFPGLSIYGTPNILGASAAIMAIFVGAAFHKPSFKVNLFGVFPVQLFVLAGLYMISDLAGISEGGRTAYVAHLGGAIFGGLSVINAHSSKNFMNRLDRFIFKLKLGSFSFKRKPKMKVYSSSSVKDMTDDEYNANKKMRKERIDAILEKISKKGYEGLTKEEKDILFNESKRG